MLHHIPIVLLWHKEQSWFEGAQCKRQCTLHTAGQLTALQGNDLTHHCSGQLQDQAHYSHAFRQAARAVRHAISHPSSPVASAQAPAQAAATDRLPGYSIGKTIGEGGFCKVRMGVHDISGQQVAIKVIDKLKLKVSKFQC